MAGGWIKVCNEEFNDLYCLPEAIKMGKWLGHVQCKRGSNL